MFVLTLNKQITEPVQEVLGKSQLYGEDLG
jgi:hypothetical protein